MRHGNVINHFVNRGIIYTQCVLYYIRVPTRKIYDFVCILYGLSALKCVKTNSADALVGDKSGVRIKSTNTGVNLQTHVWLALMCQKIRLDHMAMLYT